jgi:hypothetical protein
MLRDATNTRFPASKEMSEQKAQRAFNKEVTTTSNKGAGDNVEQTHLGSTAGHFPKEAEIAATKLGKPEHNKAGEKHGAAFGSGAEGSSDAKVSLDQSKRQ